MTVSVLREETLDDFVASVDRQGGPQLIATMPEWRSASYQPTLAIDQSLDPFSQAYCAAQIELYREISGRELDQVKNELTTVDVERHVLQRNAFGAGTPSELALHYARLSKLLLHANLRSGAKLLDMGSGWGLSSEFFASLGCEVTAVDINAQFVELIHRRSERFNYGISTIQGGFEEVSLPDQYDFIVFYECLHHAVRPWEVIARMADRLAPGGSIGFAGEPVNDIWWQHWGLRLDPLSIYCVHKYGWFENGWSQPFIMRCLEKAGLLATYVEDANPALGPIAVASRGDEMPSRCSSGMIARYFADESWILEGDYLVSKGEAGLTLAGSRVAGIARLQIMNFRGKPIALEVFDPAGIRMCQTVLEPGSNVLDISFDKANAQLRLKSESWVPRDELGIADPRTLSFHLEAIEFLDQRPAG